MSSHWTCRNANRRASSGIRTLQARGRSPQARASPLPSPCPLPPLLPSLPSVFSPFSLFSLVYHAVAVAVVSLLLYRVPYLLLFVLSRLRRLCSLAIHRYVIDLSSALRRARTLPSPTHSPFMLILRARSYFCRDVLKFVQLIFYCRLSPVLIICHSTAAPNIAMASLQQVRPIAHVRHASLLLTRSLVN